MYAVMNFGVFVCSACAGIHRELNYKVKGLSMCTFKDDELKNLSSNGNATQKKILMGKWNAKIHPEPDKRDPMKLKEFMRQKYEQKKFAGDDDDDDSDLDSDDEEEAARRRRKKKKKAAAAKKKAEEEEQDQKKQKKKKKRVEESDEDEESDYGEEIKKEEKKSTRRNKLAQPPGFKAPEPKKVEEKPVM